MQTPRYEYSRKVIKGTIDSLLSLYSPFGLTIRYAIKANPFPEIIKMMDKAGIHFDASSSYEAENLLKLGVPGKKISLSSQQSPHNLKELLGENVLFVATSLNQLKIFLQAPNRSKSVAVRINVGIGSGHNKRTSTGGVNSSFGIWHEYIDEINTLAGKEATIIDRIHIHVGSGGEESVWEKVMDASLEVLRKFTDAGILDIGGGFKVHRYENEKESDVNELMKMFNEKLRSFEKETGRKIHLEIEPGAYLVAHAGTLVAQIDDIVDTGKDGCKFLRVNTGMNDFLRSAMYGAQHKIEVINGADTREDYVVVGHNCESGDILSPAPYNPEEIATRKLKTASIGNEVRIYDAGAYCASMRAKGYNSFPDAAEIMVD